MDEIKRHLDYFTVNRPILAEFKWVLGSFAEIFLLLIILGMSFGFVSGYVCGVCVSQCGGSACVCIQTTLIPSFLPLPLVSQSQGTADAVNRCIVL